MIMKKWYIFIIAFLLAVTTLATAQDEVLVNTFTDSTQRDPHIARDAAGNYLIVWNSDEQSAAGNEGDIYFQYFTSDDVKSGAETLVNQTIAGDQEKPAVAMNGSGGGVVVWASMTGLQTNYDVMARKIQNGQPADDEFMVNTFTEFSQTNPDVAVASDGSFIIVWDSWYQDGGDRGVYAQRFDASGNPVGNEFRVNSTIQYSQSRPRVAYLHSGGFIILWESWQQEIVTPSGYGIFARLYDAAGNGISEEIQVNSYTNDYQWFGDVLVNSDDSFTVTWCSWEQDGFDGGIYLQQFDSNGEKNGAEIIVNTTKVQYQWLPRIVGWPDGKFAVVWSSWKQDGSREGIFAQYFNADGARISLEAQVNQYSPSYQWEPDACIGNENELIVTWSSWGQFGSDYEIIARRFMPLFPDGLLFPDDIFHPLGRSTSHVIVHVIDSTALTGDTYNLFFQKEGSEPVVAGLLNTGNGDTLITDFPIDRGEANFYQMPLTDGFVVQVVPEFDLKLNLSRSGFVNNSGTNLILSVGSPTGGVEKTAPIDAVLAFGSPDTLSDGRYVAPSDTAIGINGVRNVELPFHIQNITDNERISVLVIEQDYKINQRWDPGERIILMTPPAYRTSSNNTHAQVSSVLPGGAIIMPAIGDSVFIRTDRPLLGDDVYEFSTAGNIISSINDNGKMPERYFLGQNYPNPFNPITTIPFRLSKRTAVTLDVFNILGQRVARLVDKQLDAGNHRFVFDGTSFASGIYFYRINTGKEQISRRMLLIK
jgi:hypothetical protein